MSSEIAVDFKTVPCNEYCQRIADGTHDSPKETEHGRRLVTSKNVKNGRLVLDSAYLISEADFNEINRRSKVDQWDLLLTMIGTVGEVCVVEQSEPDFAIKNVGLLKCGAEHRAKWLYYFLRSPQGQGLIEQRKKGSTQQYISLTEIRHLPISYPGDEADLRGMVSALSMLDERITLLRETNATLEAIAQALFKSWFVDFDPVRAKMAGRAPEGMDEATAALFPDALEETELGVVPKGWGQRPVYETAEFINGAAYKAFNPNGERRGLPIIKIAELKAGVTSQTAFSDVEMPSKYLIETADILFSWSGNPDTSIDTFVWAHAPAWLNQHIFRVIPLHKSERAYLLQMLRYLKPEFAELARNKQTTGLGHVTVADLKILTFVWPDGGTIQAFDEIVGQIQQRILTNEQQAISLVGVRDTLLPRLISGQLRLPEAQSQLEEALA